MPSETGDIDRERFQVSERRLFGPFYGVKVFDTLAGREVPLWRGGTLLLGHGSVRRAVEHGVARYLRDDKNRTA